MQKVKAMMSNLYDRVYAVINSNEMIYDSNEFQIQMYMKNKWRDAFVAAREAEGEEFDDAFPPPVPIVADLAEDQVNDHDKFISDFKDVIRYLSRGGQIQNGKLV
jgi:hypothetical protein